MGMFEGGINCKVTVSSKLLFIYTVKNTSWDCLRVTLIAIKVTILPKLMTKCSAV